MNKQELITEVAGKAGLKKAEAANAVDAMIAAIAEALSGGGEVRLPGFGSFSVASRSASQGRNPRTGETVSIPAAKLAKFKPGKGLKEMLNAA